MASLTGLSFPYRLKPAQQIEPIESPQDVQVAATTFALFPRLPVELRLKIWRHALPGRRTVSIKAGDRRPTYRSTGEDSTLSIFRKTSGEARSVALEHHSIISSQGDILPRFFDPDHHTIRMLDQTAFYEFSGGSQRYPRKEVTAIRHLVLIIYYAEYYESFAFRCLEALTRLKSLIIEVRGSGAIDMEEEKKYFAQTWVQYLGKRSWPQQTYLLHEGQKYLVPPRELM
jgi:2EXR family